MTPPRPPRSCSLPAALPLLLAALLAAACGAHGSGPDSGAGGDRGFTHGVASFDPTQESVILWTRYVPQAGDSGGDAAVAWSVWLSDGGDPSSPLASGTSPSSADSDWCVHVIVSGLSPGLKLSYRFEADEGDGMALSDVGSTITLPAPGKVDSMKVAVMSCANYQNGLYTTYQAVAESDADLVVFLGDYIYEGAAYGANSQTEALGRLHDPAEEVRTLDGYRSRYKQYRSDPMLQQAHRAKPWVVLWDDHEVANDVFLGGSEGEDPAEYADRRLAGLTAWHEYMGTSVDIADLKQDYVDDLDEVKRVFQLSDIATLYVTDQRHKRDGPPNNDALGLPVNLSDAQRDVWQSPNRTMLGEEQLAWLQSKIETYTPRSTWQIYASTTVMGKQDYPAEVLTQFSQALAAGGAGPELFAFLQTSASLLDAKIRRSRGEDIPDETAARLDNVLPLGLDAWGGFPAEREKIFRTAQAAGSNLISIAGDSHNHWNFDLTNSDGDFVGVEFAGTSVSSPGFGAALPAALATPIADFISFPKDLRFTNIFEYGFVMLTLNRTAVTGEHFGVKIAAGSTSDAELLYSRTLEPWSAPAGCEARPAGYACAGPLDARGYDVTRACGVEVAECARLCDAVIKCAGFTHVTGTGPGAAGRGECCYLKRTIPGTLQRFRRGDRGATFEKLVA